MNTDSSAALSMSRPAPQSMSTNAPLSTRRNAPTANRSYSTVCLLKLALFTNLNHQPLAVVDTYLVAGLWGAQADLH